MRCLVDVVVRLGYMLLLAVISSFAVFAAFSVLPGDSATVALGMEANDREIAIYRSHYGYDKPLVWRYGMWLVQVAKGNLGVSSRYQIPISQLLNRHLVVTLRLATLALLFTVMLALPLAWFITLLNHPFAYYTASLSTQLVLAVPQFWLGMYAMQLLGVHWGLVVLYTHQTTLATLWLPAACLALGNGVYLSRYLAYHWRLALQSRYTNTMRALGASELIVTFQYALKGSLIPTVAMFGLTAIDLLGGSVLIESIFGLSGLGSLLVTAIASRDFALVQAICLYYVVLVLILSFLVDSAYQWLDPRLKTVSTVAAIEAE